MLLIAQDLIIEGKIMVIVIKDVADHFNCDILSANKIIRLLMKSPEVYMDKKGTVDFKFCGVMYSLTRSDDNWLMTRSITSMSNNLDDIL